MAFDAAGNIFVADGFGNARVAKFDKTGRFIKSWGSRGAGQDQFDTPLSIATDAQGNVYVVGLTYSPDFPVTAGAVQTKFGGTCDAFVAKAGPDGKLIWSTYLGGILDDWATGVALFACWNLGTLIGALATHALPNPKVLGFDAAPPAAFLALLAPKLRAREPLAIALVAAAIALICLPFVPAGIPLLIVALLVAAFGFWTRAK